MPEKTYSKKRSFDRTPEPQPEVDGNVDPTTARPGPTFMIHQHHARRLHFDLRLEMMNGKVPVLVSWAVPKNLPRARGKPHLAVHVEDHPFEYGSFSGTIPAGNYGAGEVRIFDRGTYEVLEQEEDKLTFRLKGERLQGIWHMVRTHKTNKDNEWLVFLKEQERPDPDPPPEPSPMLATLVAEPFDGDDWLFEVKWDGVRALAVCSDETALYSRNRNDITASYPELHRLHERLVALDAIVDGEVVAMHNGRPSFERLQSRINLQNPKEVERIAKSIPVTFIAFDLLYLDDVSLVSKPIEERKRILEEIVVPSDNVQVSPTTTGDGTSLFEIACAQKLEGIVAKKLGSPYRPGRRTREWLKVKAVYESEVVIGGWSKGEGSRSSTFGSILVGAYSDRGLEFLGSVGTGFTEAVLSEVLKELAKHTTDECPFVEDPSGTRSRFGKTVKNPQWVRPELVAKVEYREVTSGYRLRAPSFKGLVGKADPSDCRIENLEVFDGR
ncbi:MAG TPA: non-homologous end-joining DNA ligase [Actinomycetota bacterium]|nr:non-homologous end-joining DNA ligase [Actinomycetota bacterium]